MLRKIDDWLNSITMYRLVQFGLMGFLVIAAALNVFLDFGVSSIGIVVSFFILSFVCYGFSLLFGSIFRAPTNVESPVITALILVCLVAPPTTLNRALAIAVAGIIATASKYILAINKSHIFNPAAFAALAVSTLGILPVTWWVVTPALLPFILVLGLLIVRKIRRVEMFLVFVAVSMAVMLVVNSGDQTVFGLLRSFVLSWPLVFFGTIMLTEPSTTPASRYYRNLYAVLVGVIFASHIGIGPFDSSPELALLIGNLFAFVITPKQKVLLALKQKLQLTPTVTHFEFETPKKLSYQPGQYLEVTLPQSKTDGRGNRRTFTIASSPTESSIQFGIKFYKPGSTFKSAFAKLELGDKMIAGNIGGNFLLPKDQSIPLVFIAGGIGVTPFRSMVKYLLDTKQKREITLLYFVNSEQEAAYKKLFEDARAVGVSLQIFTKPLAKDALKEYIDEQQKQHFYISGPPNMVREHKGNLKNLGIHGRAIHTDYFSGY